MKRILQSNRRATVFAWTVLTLVVPMLFYWASAFNRDRPSDESGEPTDELLERIDKIAALVADIIVWSYFGVWLAALIGSLMVLAYSSIKTKYWCWREDQTIRTWKGGTRECLVMGDLLMNGPVLRSGEWKDLCDELVGDNE